MRLKDAFEVAEGFPRAVGGKRHQAEIVTRGAVAGVQFQDFPERAGGRIQSFLLQISGAEVGVGSGVARLEGDGAEKMLLGFGEVRPHRGDEPQDDFGVAQRRIDLESFGGCLAALFPLLALEVLLRLEEPASRVVRERGKEDQKR